MTKARNLAKLISDNIVGTAEIDDGAVTTAKLADDAVTPAKLNVNGADIPYDNSVSGISATTLQAAIDYLNVLSGGGSAGAQATYTREEFTATAGQTTFTTANGYTLGYLQVFMNGIMLDSGDYTANDESTVVLGAGAAVNDEVTTIAYDSFAISEVLRVLNISASAPDNSVVLNADGGIQLGGTGGGTGGAVLHLEKGNLGTSAGDYDTLHRVYQHNGNASYLDTMQVRTYANNVWPGAGFRIQQKIDSTWMGFVEFNGATNGGVSIGTGLSTGNPNDITRRLTVDPEGRVTMPYQPAFSARLTATTASLTGATVYYTGVFNSTAVNRGNAYNTSTNKFTAPVSGVYHFASHILFSTTSTGRPTEFWFSVNDDAQRWFADRKLLASTTGNMQTVSGAASIYLSAGDYVSVRGFVLGGAQDVSLQGSSGVNSAVTVFSGYLIG